MCKCRDNPFVSARARIADNFYRSRPYRYLSRNICMYIVYLIDTHLHLADAKASGIKNN